MKLNIILILFYISNANAESLLNRLTTFITNSESYSVCPESGPTPEVCVTGKANLYVYDSEYGGRLAKGTNIVFTANTLEHTLPVGWYEDNSANLSYSLFSPGNFSSSLTLFGVAGLVSGSSLPECDYGTNMAPVALSSKCQITAPHFVYPLTQPYGVRTNKCEVPAPMVTTTKTNLNKCWLEVGSGGMYLAGAANLPMCNLSVDAVGLISQDCTASINSDSSGSYFYNTAYNGKSGNCNANDAGVSNTASCYVPADKTYFKVTNACTINSINTVACEVTAGNYPYTVAYGGRGLACDAAANTSNCWFASPNKSSGIGSTLIDANVRTGINIFGVTGNYDGNPTEWGTGAPKSNGTVKGTYKDEAYCGLDKKWTKASGCINNTAHRLVPVISADHDGEISNFFVDRANWGNTECGLSGSVDDRIADCTTRINAALSGASVAATPRNTAVWNADGSMGNSGFSIWKLISRVNAIGVGLIEVWRDENTKLYWSSRISANINWCRASGSSNNLKFPDSAENDPANICNQQSNQEQVSTQNIISACFEGPGFSDNHSDILPFNHATIPAGQAAGKAGLHSSSGQKIYWRLPTIYDYRLAHYNGIRFVLPDMAGQNANEEWTATVYSQDRSKAWTFQSANGQKAFKTRNIKLAARCIGRGF